MKINSNFKEVLSHTQSAIQYYDNKQKENAIWEAHQAFSIIDNKFDIENPNPKFPKMRRFIIEERPREISQKEYKDTFEDVISQLIVWSLEYISYRREFDVKQHVLQLDKLVRLTLEETSSLDKENQISDELYELSRKVESSHDYSEHKNKLQETQTHIQGLGTISANY